VSSAPPSHPCQSLAPTTRKDPHLAPKNIVRVVLWMSGALPASSAMAVSVRVLAATLGVMEILALRAGLGLMVMAILAAVRADLRATINCRHLPLHLLRNTVHVCASY